MITHLFPQLKNQPLITVLGGCTAPSIKGSLYGLAIGDAMGLKAEYLPAQDVARLYPHGVPRFFESVDRTIFGYQEIFQAGQWSDDTDQSLCILASYLEGMSPRDLAEAFAKVLPSWGEANPKCMGLHTRTVLRDPQYLDNPFQVSQRIWEQRNPSIPPNGGVMRAAVVGLLNPTDISWTEEAAKLVCQVTHYGEGCVASSVAASVATALLTQGQPYTGVMSDVTQIVSRYDKAAIPWLGMDLPDLQLDEGLPLRKGVPTTAGHAYKTMGAGFWALREAQKEDPGFFRKTLGSIILSGGDTDTNCCVAGALLGAFAPDKIPASLITSLQPIQ